MGLNSAQSMEKGQSYYKNLSKIDIKLLKTYLKYDPDSGLFTWIKSLGAGTEGKIAGCYKHKKRYVYLAFRRVHLPAHQVAWLYMTGEIPYGYLIDHRDRNGHNNKWNNLRLATFAQSSQNRASKGTFSKFKGVYKSDVPSKPFRVRISHNKKHVELGHFLDEIEAAKAYDRKALELFGEFAQLNFPI